MWFHNQAEVQNQTIQRRAGEKRGLRSADNITGSGEQAESEVSPGRREGEGTSRGLPGNGDNEDQAESGSSQRSPTSVAALPSSVFTTSKSLLSIL